MENVVLKSFRKFNLIYIIILLNSLSLLNTLYFYFLNNGLDVYIPDFIVSLAVIIIYMLLATVRDKTNITIFITLLLLMNAFFLVKSIDIVSYKDLSKIYLINQYFKLAKISFISIFVKIFDLIFLFSIIIGLINKNKDKFVKIIIITSTIINLISHLLYLIYYIYYWLNNIIEHNGIYRFYLNHIDFLVFFILTIIISILSLITWSVFMYIFLINIQKQFNYNVDYLKI